MVCEFRQAKNGQKERNPAILCGNRGRRPEVSVIRCRPWPEQEQFRW